MNLRVEPGTYGIVRLVASSAIPSWIQHGNFVSITRTREELSIVCEENLIPSDVKREGARKLLKVEGPLDFSLTGILSSLLTPLAEAKISIFALSTFDTDFLLIHEKDLALTIKALTTAGHKITNESNH